MLREIAERQEYQRGCCSDTVSVREDPGALRDIQDQVTAALARTAGGSRTWAACEKPWRTPCRRMADSRTPARASACSLRHFRDTYSLSQTERMTKHPAGPPGPSTAHRMGFEAGRSPGETGTAPRLLRTYRYHRLRSQRAIACIAAAIAP